jgi:viroplasmin and RNaseH domain-containing protein
MNRFLLFAGYDYYPAGGWGDFKGSFDSKEEAEEFLSQSEENYDWDQIIDTADPSNFPSVS